MNFKFMSIPYYNISYNFNIALSLSYKEKYTRYLLPAFTTKVLKYFYTTAYYNPCVVIF